MADEARITHALSEVIRDGDPNARITHALSEVIRDGDPNARITHALSEVIRDGDPNARITHAIVEVLRSNTTQNIKLDKLYLSVSLKNITVSLSAASHGDFFLVM